MNIVQRTDLIVERSRGRSVLHLGCTNHPYTQDAIDRDMLLHFDLAKVSDELFGFDYDQEGLDTLAAAGVDNLFRADLERLDEVPLDRTFDVIIAGEMIEHLSNPGMFLRGIQRFMSADTELVITTINAYCALRFAMYALRGKGGVSEPVHPDHVYYFSYRTLSHLIDRADLDVVDFMFYDLGKEHRPYNPWYLNLANDIAVKISRQLADGVIAVCKLKK